MQKGLLTMEDIEMAAADGNCFSFVFLYLSDYLFSISACILAMKTDVIGRDSI